MWIKMFVSWKALAKTENEALSVWWDPEMPSRSESSNSLMDGVGNDLPVCTTPCYFTHSLIWPYSTRLTRCLSNHWISCFWFFYLIPHASHSESSGEHHLLLCVPRGYKTGEGDSLSKDDTGNIQLSNY